MKLAPRTVRSAWAVCLIAVGCFLAAEAAEESSLELPNLDQLIARVKGWEESRGLVFEIGRLPDSPLSGLGMDTSFEETIPLPEEFQVLGSIKPRSGRQDWVFVALETQTPGHDLLQLYRSELERSGWTLKGDHLLGFKPPLISYRRDSDRLRVDVRARENSNGRTELPLLISLSPSPETEPSEREPRDLLNRWSLPWLIPPPQSRFDSWGMNGSRLSRADLVSRMSASEVTDWYEAPIRRQGWEQIHTEQLDTVAISQWTLPNSPSNQILQFSVWEMPDFPERMLLHMMVREVEPDLQ